jgi:hypothetical protein
MSSSSEAICPATGDSGPTRDSAIARTNAAALSSVLVRDSPAAMLRGSAQQGLAHFAPVDEALQIHQ